MIGRGIAALLLAGTATAADGTPVLTTPHFAFFSDLATNTNDALIAAGLAHQDGKPELFHAGDEAVCFAKLPAPVRTAWDAAVGYYATTVSPGGWIGQEQYLIRVELAGLEHELKTPADREFAGIARGFLAAATPAYAACRWKAQDEKNRAWVDALKPQLAEVESKIAERLAALYRTRWAGLPIRVDIVEVVNWSGANSILLEGGGGHLLVASENPVKSGVEIVFHESSHVFMGRNAPVRRALDEAANAAGRPAPPDLWHVVLFYTTGEAVRRILDARGGPSYTPMLEEIFARGSWTEFREPLASAWRPYVDGNRMLAEAATALVEALQKPGIKTRE